MHALVYYRILYLLYVMDNIDLTVGLHSPGEYVNAHDL